MTDLVGQKASFEFHLIKILVETEMCVCVGTFKRSNYEVPFSKEPVSQPNIPFLKSSSFFKHPEKGKLILFFGFFVLGKTWSNISVAEFLTIF